MILYRLLFSLLILLFSSFAFAADSNLRAFEHADLSDSQTLIECMAAMKRSGQPMVLPSIVYARMDQGLLQEIAGNVLDANLKKGPEPENLEEIDRLHREHLEEASAWFHIGARSSPWKDSQGVEHTGVQAGDHFITRFGRHRWTKIYQSSSPRPTIEDSAQAFPPGGREVWLAPNGNLVGDVIGKMNHYDAQRIDRALIVLFEQAVLENGIWKWPEEVEGKPFDPKAFLRGEMERGVSVHQLPSGDPWTRRAPENVGRYFDSLLESVGGILEPDFPWRLPRQIGEGTYSPGPDRQLSELRQLGALEVLPGFLEGKESRLFWTSSVDTQPYSACIFKSFGVIGYFDRGVPGASVRLIAQPRPAPKSSGESQ